MFYPIFNFCENFLPFKVLLKTKQLFVFIVCKTCSGGGDFPSIIVIALSITEKIGLGIIHNSSEIFLYVGSGFVCLLFT